MENRKMKVDRSPALVAYLALEVAVKAASDEAQADRLRDAMDLVWANLTDEERVELNERIAGA